MAPEYLYTRDNILAEINKHPKGQVHEKDVYVKWDLFEKTLKRQTDIKLPEHVDDLESLKRLMAHTNFAKVIVNATVTMLLANGAKVYNESGLIDKEASQGIDLRLVRRATRYASTYGGCWLHIIRDDKENPLRVEKPHLARRVFDPEDKAKELGVVMIEKIYFAPTLADDKVTPVKDDDYYYRARWYEWSKDRKWVRKITYHSDSRALGGWRQVGEDEQFNYMPLLFVAAHDADEIPEASDIVDGIELFEQYDNLLVKFLKSLEDEAFRIIFISQIGEEQAKKMQVGGGKNFWYAKTANPAEHPPELQSINPSDHRQFLEALSDLVDSIATVTRTSPMELNERPTQDIPAQTLRVIMGPQLERVGETAEYMSKAFSEAVHVLNSQSGGPRDPYDPRGQARVEFRAQLPVSEDKVHQNLKGMLDADAYSAVDLIMKAEGSTRPEAEQVFERRLAEKRRIAEIETAEEVKVEEAKAAARPVPRPPA